MNKYNIIIEGFENPRQFVDKWSSQYSYSNKEKYNNNINSVLDNEQSFYQLFQWKNGTGDIIFDKKKKVVDGFYEKIDTLRHLKYNFNWELFENEFHPTMNSPIWKIFLLHLINPLEFPIFDQHVFRL